MTHMPKAQYDKEKVYPNLSDSNNYALSYYLFGFTIILIFTLILNLIVHFYFFQQLPNYVDVRQNTPLHFTQVKTPWPLHPILVKTCFHW